LCRSAHAVKTWTNFGKVEAVPETLCMYPVPSTVSTATGSSSRRTFSSNESAFSRTVMEEEPCYCSKKPTHKVLEMDPDDKNEDELKNLSMAEAAEILAESNLASHSAHEVAAKFSQAKQDGSTTFSKRFLKSCHLYGEMGDQVQSVMKKINKLQKGDTVTSEEIQPEALCELTREKTLEQLKHMFTSDEEDVHRDDLVNTLKKMLSSLDGFHWDNLINDLRRWIQTTEISETSVREFLQQLVEQERDVISLLALSRCLV